MDEVRARLKAALAARKGQGGAWPAEHLLPIIFYYF
jgi:hypothetical protein